MEPGHDPLGPCAASVGVDARIPLNTQARPD